MSTIATRFGRKRYTFECGLHDVFCESLNRPFHSCGSVTRPMNGSEAAGDFVLIQSSLLFLCKCRLVMHQSIPAVTIPPPGPTPGDLWVFFRGTTNSPPPSCQKLQIPPLSQIIFCFPWEFELAGFYSI